MSVGEFGLFISTNPFRTYSYESNKQEWFSKTKTPDRISVTFSDIAITICPNIIDFRGNNGMLSLEFVKRVDVREDKSGLALDIICGFCGEKERKYTVIATN